MTNTITLTDEQMKALQSGQSITIEPPKPATKWEPKGGGYTIGLNFSIINYQSTEKIRLLGLAYQTQQQAEQAAKALRSYARQLNWISENDDGFKADWSSFNQKKYCIVFNNRHNKYTYEIYAENNYINCIFMSQDNAKKLVELLNDGTVEF